jgi:hypothetical protein
MAIPNDILGAIASNAGDEFHEIWSLRKALALLDPSGSLSAMSMEGVVSQTSCSGDSRQWDGVDCALYFGGTSLESAERIELIQLKYSIAAPRKNWTLGRLTRNTKTRGNNSVARRLANAYTGAIKNRSGEFAEEQVSVSLVSNQPIGAKLDALLKKVTAGKSSSKDAESLRAATGLSKKRFRLFCHSLILVGASEARSILKSDVIRRIADVTDSDVSGTLADLRQTVREQMLPESNKAPITHATLLSWFKIGDPHSLFPCKSQIERNIDAIPRKVIDDLADAVVSNPFVCLEGRGACGKTTAIMNLEKELPPESQVVIFDCYGGGSHLDPSLSRHRPSEAFTQLSNDLALKLRVPFLIPHRDNPNVSSSFRRRVEIASEVLTAESPAALLVIVADAADNSVFAANQSTPPDRCFVHDFIRISGLPENVRMVVTTRTSRIRRLNIPDDYVHIVCGPFELAETTLFVQRHWNNSTEQEIEQFHHLSNAIPRVQGSTVSQVDTLTEALDFLRPNGKTLDDLFEAILKESSSKLAGDETVDRFCSAVSVLPTPAPLRFLADLCGESEEFVRETSDDLSPNVRISSSGLEFANEDFEEFVRRRGKRYESQIADKAATLLTDHRLTSSYAAIHLSDILSKACRASELFDLLEEEDSTRAITDKVIRRRTDLRRLKAAVSLAAESADLVKAGKTVLIGAEAARTSSKVGDLLRQNIDLSAVFAEQTIRQDVLRNPDERGLHGSLLMHLAKEKALQQDTLPIAREYVRLALEWVRERARSDDKSSYEWNLGDSDLVGLVYAAYRDVGWEKVEEFCMSWQPDLLPLSLLTGLIQEILLREGTSAVRGIRSEISLDLRWLTTVYLRRAGIGVSKTDLRQELKLVLDYEFPSLSTGSSFQMQEGRNTAIIYDLLFFADICIYRSLSKKAVFSLLELAWPKAERSFIKVSPRNAVGIDLTLQVESILSYLNGESLSSEGAFQIEETDSDEDDEFRKDSKKELVKFADFVKEFYEITAKLFCDSSAETVLGDLKAAMNALDKNAWRYEQRYEFNVFRQFVIRRIVDIQAIYDLKKDEMIDLLQSFFSKYNVFGQRLHDSFQQLLYDPNSFDPVCEALRNYSKIAIDYNSPASERAQVLIDTSRLLLSVSREESEGYFELATKVIEEMDVEAIDEIHFLTRASAAFPNGASNSAMYCAKIAAIVEQARIVLEHADEFPTEKVVASMEGLSTPVAMCAVARWTDVGLFDTQRTLRYLLLSMLESDRVDAVVVAALMLLASDTGLELSKEVISVSEPLGDDVRRRIIAEVANRSILLDSLDHVTSRWEELEAAVRNQHMQSPAVKELDTLMDFLNSNRDLLTTDEFKPESVGVAANRSERKRKTRSKRAVIDPSSAASVSQAIEANRADGIFDDEGFFEKLRDQVRPNKRIEHLDALSQLAQSADWPRRYIDAINRCLDIWQGVATDRWTSLNIQELVVTLGASLAGFGWYDEECIDSLIGKAGLDNESTAKVILKSIEYNGEQFGSVTLYKYAAKLIQVMPDDEAHDLFEWYLNRKMASLDKDSVGESVVEIQPETLPADLEDCLSYFLYRFLGDVDVRNRWKAAHALRVLMRLGHVNLLPKVLKCRPNNMSFVFAAPTVPFHFLTAEVWLAMALSRIACETPKVIAENAKMILSLVQGNTPHLLVSMHIKRSLSAAAEVEKLNDVSVNDYLNLAMPIAGRKEVGDRYGRRGFGHATSQENVRFHFDSMDVLPYWYDRALEVFADVTPEEFLIEADKWIVDEWQGDSETSRWDREPRQRRFDNRDFGSWSTDHGSYPALERHSAYLQWHAMFVVVADFLKSRPISDLDGDDFHSLSEWMQSWDVTQETYWLSDLREPKPLATRFWRPLPTKDDSWFEIDDQAEFLEQLTDESGWIVLSCERDTRRLSYGSREGSERVRVISALVPPKTASALLRALQIVGGPWEYYLPVEPNHDVRDQPGISDFCMEPAVANPFAHRDLGFDDSDPLRFSIRGVQAAPAKKIVEELRLTQSEQPPIAWRSGSADDPVVRYRAWRDLADARNDLEYRQSKGQFADGYALSIDSHKLIEVLSELKMDMIFSVQMERKGEERGGRFDEEEAQESIYDKLYILRQDGAFEDISGNLGVRVQDRR